MIDTNPFREAPHLLLIEDDPLCTRLIHDIMRKLGLGLSIAADGPAALRLCKERYFDLILMDLHMPEMDGYATREGILELLRGQTVPAMICLTADTLDTTRLRLQHAGFDDILYKPLDVNLLLERMAHLIDIPIEMSGLQAAAREAMPNQLRADLHGMLVASLSEERQRLREASEQDDRDSLVHIAHTLAGNAAICGVSVLSQAAMKLERSLRLGSDDESDAALAMLLRLIEPLLEES